MHYIIFVTKWLNVCVPTEQMEFSTGLVLLYITFFTPSQNIIIIKKVNVV